MELRKDVKNITVWVVSWIMEERQTLVPVNGYTKLFMQK